MEETQYLPEEELVEKVRVENTDGLNTSTIILLNGRKSSLNTARNMVSQPTRTPQSSLWTTRTG